MSINWDNIDQTLPLGDGEKEESYKASQELLKLYFQKDDHSDINKIYHRVTLLNSFYSTRMGAERCWAVAKHLYEKRDLFNKLIFQNDEDKKIILINELIPQIKYNVTDKKTQQIKQLDFRPYSFITKYCSIYTWIKDEQNCLYPIYDSLVREILKKEKHKSLNPRVQSILKKYTINTNPENYKQFYEALKELKEEFNTDFRTLDIFLWREGKNKNQKTTQN